MTEQKEQIGPPPSLEQLHAELQRVGRAIGRVEVTKQIVGTVAFISHPEWDLTKLSGRERISMAIKVGGIREKIVEQTLPRLFTHQEKIERELNEAEENPSKSLIVVAVRERSVVVPQEAVSGALNIFEHVPEKDLIRWAEREHLKPSQCAQEAMTLALLAHSLQSGAVRPIEPLSIVKTPPSQKPIIAQERIRQLLAPLAFIRTEKDKKRFEYDWARGIRELIDWLGGKEYLNKAINRLSEVEEALFWNVSSDLLAEDLDCGDLDTCDELCFARHIRNITSHRSVDEKYQDLEKLIKVAWERDEYGDLDSHQVIDLLINPEKPWRHQAIFEELKTAAETQGCRDILMSFFSQHPVSSRFAKMIEADLRLPQIYSAEEIEFDQEVD